MQRDGRPVSDPADVQIMATEVAQRFVERRMPLLAMLGVT